MSKRSLMFLLALLLVFMASPSQVLASSIRVIIDNEVVEFDPGPIMSEGRVLLPMRGLFEALGAEVLWEEDTWTAIGKRGDIEVRIPVDSRFPLVNGVPKEIDIPASIIGGSTFVPLRFVGEALGDDVFWDQHAYAAVIYKDIPEEDESGPGYSGEMTEVSRDIYRIEPSPGSGFHWPYFLYVPASLKPGDTYLLVEGNNTGFRSDDQDIHESRALNRIEWSKIFLGRPLNVPAIIPTFPRPTEPEEIYTQILCDRTLRITVGRMARIDLQLLAMVDDARKRLDDRGIILKDKFLMHGFSTSGSFAVNMALIHPELIQAAAIGAPGMWPTALLGEWKGASLPYPIGIGDIEDILGEELNMEDFRQIPLFFYYGTEDNDSDIYEFNTFMRETFGKTSLERWGHIKEIYDTAGANIIIKAYEGIGHQRDTDTMIPDVLEFFRQHGPE